MKIFLCFLIGLSCGFIIVRIYSVVRDRLFKRKLKKMVNNNEF